MRNVILLACLSAVSCGWAEIEIVAPIPGETVSLLTPAQRRFVDMDFAVRAKYFVDANKALRNEMRTWGTTPRPVCLKWKGTTRPCDVFVRKRGESTPVFRRMVATNCVSVWNLEIGEVYEWTVGTDGYAARGWFATDATAPRFVKVDGVANCRDLGGRVGLGGRRVRQGLVYRTAEYNRSTTEKHPPPSETLITKEGRTELCGRLGVRTDIDLRRPDEYVGVSASPLGPEVVWVCHHASVLCYSNVVSSTRGREQFRRIFRVFLDKKNYPIAFHCRGGADRTGTVGMILNALLGVCEDDLWKDYQVTAFWGTVGDTRHFRLFEGLLKAFDRYPGATLCERVAAYVKELGFTDADIAAFRRRMLESVARPDLVEKVAAGELKSAKASWWGFDPVDSTRFLQAAIDSKVPDLTVDRQSGAWVVRPLRGISDQRIAFEKGVEVAARKDAFHGLNDCLLKYDAKTNVVLKGEGAMLRMCRWDYHAAPYRKGEWRHALSLLSCANVTVEGLTLAESGGDGIYVGVFRKGGPCRNVVIRDCICEKNYRQGISVISADGLLVERTVMRKTAGTPPAAGIDFEPNNPSELLRACVMRGCVCEDNQGNSAEVYLGKFDRCSAPVSIRLENCRLSGAGKAGFGLSNGVRGDSEDYPRGEVTLEDCVIERSHGAGIAVSDKPLDSIRLTARACRLEKNCEGAPDVSDVSLRLRGLGGVVPDGIRLDAVSVVQQVARPWITRMDTIWLERPVFAIEGTVRVSDPNGTRSLILDDAWRREIFGTDENLSRPVWRPFDPEKYTAVDPRPGVARALVPLRPRGKARYVFFVNRPQTVELKGRAFEYAKGRRGTYRVLELNTGCEVVAGTLPDAGGGSLSFRLERTGFCALDVDMGQRNAFAMTEANVPIAIALSRGGQHFIGGGGEVGFAVLVEEPISVVAVGSGGSEFASIAVRDPYGAEVWRNDRVDGPAGWTSGENASSGFWSLKIGKPSSGCFEDHFVALRGTIPFLFLESSPRGCWLRMKRECE